MGEDAAGEAWAEAVDAFLEKLKGKIYVESRSVMVPRPEGAAAFGAVWAS
ncbi:MAG: hypothetical protein ACP5QI_08615 [Candidatus Bathyarchaeia archaeon]